MPTLPNTTLKHVATQSHNFYSPTFHTASSRQFGRSFSSDADGDGPLTVDGHLGTVKIRVLLDSGSDLDCMNAELAEVLSQVQSPALVSRKPRRLRAKGFTNDTVQESLHESTWKLTLQGYPTLNGRRSVEVTRKVTLREFSALGDDVILGIDNLTKEGFQATYSHAQLFDLWMPRTMAIRAPLPSANAVGTMLPLPDQFRTSNIRVDSRGWYPITLRVNLTTFGSQLPQSLWCEGSSDLPDGLHVLESPLAADADIGDDVLLRVFVTVDPGKEVLWLLPTFEPALLKT